MANPAELLLHTFTRWNSSAADARGARGLNGNNWDEHKRALRHLDEIDELLRSLESQGRNTRVFRQWMPAWHRIVFAYDRGWVPVGSGQVDQQAIDHLETLAERLQDVVPTLQEGGIAQILEYTNGIAQTVAEDESLPVQLRSHINDVIAHVRWCAENYDIVGDFSLDDAIERLNGAVVRGAANSSHPGRWTKIMNTFVYPFVVNAVAALPAAGLQIAAVAS